jgi:hypothetical protein
LGRTNTLDRDPEAPDTGNATNLADLKVAVETFVEDEVDWLLVLLCGEEVPYEDISHRLNAEKGCKISVAALRQRFARATHDLRAKLSN